MGKKLSQASFKISKNEKQQLNSLIKVLRPKVYITDCSSFKKLVQDLTGNGSTVITSPHPTKPEAVEKVPVIEIEDHGDPEISSIELSIDSSEVGDNPTTPFAPFETSLANQQADLLQYRDLESWLLEIEPLPNFYNDYDYAPQIEPEVCTYDYDLSWLL